MTAASGGTISTDMMAESSWPWTQRAGDTSPPCRRLRSPQTDGTVQVYKQGQRQRNYLQDICIEWLRKYVEYGREELERRVQPKVKVSGQDTGDSLLLHCQVYGFHPRAVHVKWMKNGVDDVPTYQTTHTLPNPDGTYQTRVTAEVIPKEGDSYSCYVDHSSLAERLNIVWEKPQSGWLIPVVIAAVVIAVLALCIAGFLLYKKNRNGYKTTNSEYSAYEMHCEIGNRN
ncbi:Belongs to the MHC class I family [Pristimantis euphronides]